MTSLRPLAMRAIEIANRPELGWNGVFKDALQAAEVYAWTLEADYLDNTSTPEPLKGSVTLVR